MSGYRKALKIVSIIEIVLAVLALLAALASMGVIALGPEVTSETVSADGVTLTVGQTFATFGAVALISGLIDLVVGILGVRGANNPEKIGAYYVLAIIALVFDLVEFVLSVVSLIQGTESVEGFISALIAAAITGIFVFVARKIKEEAAA